MRTQTESAKQGTCVLSSSHVFSILFLTLLNLCGSCVVEDVSHASPLALRQYLRVRFLGGRRLKVRASLAALPFGLVGLGHFIMRVPITPWEKPDPGWLQEREDAALAG